MSDTGKLLANVAAIVVIGGVLMRMFFIEVVRVNTNVMAPTLVYGDEVLVWKGAHADVTDVMVCEHPYRKGELVFGRVIAKAGYTVRTDYNGQLYIGDDQTTTGSGRDVLFYDVTRKKQFDMQMRHIDFFGRHDHMYFQERGTKLRIRPYRVKTGVYLLGDNRMERQSDSRKFGEVQPEHCLGQVFMRWKAAEPTGDDLDNAPLDLIR
ncbi:MAG: signal peptidase I [Myxococcales bacterium]|jgi:signal peptidase I